MILDDADPGRIVRALRRSIFFVCIGVLAGIADIPAKYINAVLFDPRPDPDTVELLRRAFASEGVDLTADSETIALQIKEARNRHKQTKARVEAWVVERRSK